MLIAIMIIRTACALLITIRAHAVAERATLFVASHLDSDLVSVEAQADRMLTQGAAIASGTISWNVRGGGVTLSFRTASEPLLGVGELGIHASALLN